MILFFIIQIQITNGFFKDELIPKGLSFKSMKELPSAKKINLPINKSSMLQEKKFMKAKEIQNAIVARKNVVKLGLMKIDSLQKRLKESPSIEDKNNVKKMIKNVNNMIKTASLELPKQQAKLSKLVSSTPNSMKPLIAAGIAHQTLRQQEARRYYHR